MLNSKQRAILKKEAQRLKPLFQVGTNKVHTNNISAIVEAFNTREIVKVKVNRDNNEDKLIVNNIAEELAKAIPAEVVCIIGTTIILYKNNNKLKVQIKI